MGPGGYWRPTAAIKPGVIPLRPLGLGEILDGAFSTMRAHPKLMLGVAAIVVTIVQLLNLAATFPWLDDIRSVDPYATPDELLSTAGKSLAVSGIGLLLTIFSRVFLSGFVTLVVGKSVLGQPLTFGDVWTGVRPRLLPLLGLTFVYPAVAFGGAVVVGLLFVLAPALGVLAALGLVVVGIWLMIMFSLATPALVLENAKVGRAFGRSRELVRQTWWRIFGITLLAGVIAGFIALIITLPFQLFGGGFSNITSPEAIITTRYLLLTSIGAIIASTITEPFVAAVTVLLYTDQRIRKEGLDIELARAANQPR